MALSIETPTRDTHAEETQSDLICDVMASRQRGASSLTPEERGALRRLRRELQAPSEGLRALLALNETPLHLDASR